VIAFDHPVFPDISRDVSVLQAGRLETKTARYTKNPIMNDIAVIWSGSVDDTVVGEKGNILGGSNFLIYVSC